MEHRNIATRITRGSPVVRNEVARYHRAMKYERASLPVGLVKVRLCRFNCGDVFA